MLIRSNARPNARQHGSLVAKIDSEICSLSGAREGCLTLARAIDLYLEALEARRTPSNTRKAYRLDLAAFERAFPELELADTTPVLLRSYLGEGTWSPATRSRRRASLASFFRWLTRNDLVGANPMDRVETVAVPETLPRPVDPESVEAILGRIPPSATRDRALFTLVYETGVRIAEALGLYVHDLELARDNEKIRVLGKGNRERTVLLAAAPRSVRLLRRHLKLQGIESGAIFRGDPTRGGSNAPMDYTTARRSWNVYCQAAGVQATLHQLRHTRATELVRGGVPLGTIRKVLGHRNIQSTLIYADVDEETVKRDLLEYRRRKR